MDFYNLLKDVLDPNEFFKTVILDNMILDESKNLREYTYKTIK